MQNAELKALAEEIEAATAISGALDERARAALRLAGLPYTTGFDTADAVLALVNIALPGWAISLEGTASTAHGHWTCTLRKSRERDNDEFIGIGRGVALAPALLSALIKVLALTRA